MSRSPLPPMPSHRVGRVSLWRYLRLFRKDILSAQPAKLYRARMAEFRTPFFRSFLVNEPLLVQELLRSDPAVLPKSRRVAEGLRPLLGQSVFLTNGDTWARQRRLIDPAFEGGRVRAMLPAIWDAAEAAAQRLAARSGQCIEVEQETSRAAADVIFRTLFSISINHRQASAVFTAFRSYQRAQPILNLRALLPLPKWCPWLRHLRTRRSTHRIRQMITGLVSERAAALAAGSAPDDLCSRLMRARDPSGGSGFDDRELADQVAIFFLAGHETSASALAWSLYLLAIHPTWQARVAEEAKSLRAGDMKSLNQLHITRDVFREALRLYPPVPMMVRQTTCPMRLRDRKVAPGSQIVISPWHLHRNERIWTDPHHFDPARWRDPKQATARKTAFIPFSTGPRVCPGAGFAMAEGTLLLARVLRDLHVEPARHLPPVPVAHLTVRAHSGIHLRFLPRKSKGADCLSTQL